MAATSTGVILLLVLCLHETQSNKLPVKMIVNATSHLLELEPSFLGCNLLGFRAACCSLCSHGVSND